MKRIAAISILALAAALPAAAQTKQHHFATKEQVIGLVYRAQVALDVYESIVSTEDSLRHDAAMDKIIAHEQKVIRESREYLSRLNSDPSGFNSPTGLGLERALMNASVLATGCSMNAMPLYDTDHEAITRSCWEASQRLSQIAFEGGDLYYEYLLAAEELHQQTFDALMKCSSQPTREKKP
jgi:hypothetical protein